MSFHFPAGENYDCITCGRCCSAPWQVPIRSAMVERLQSHALGIRVIQEHGTLCEQVEDGNWVINKKSDAACVFLDVQKYCLIHSELGPEQKPRVCQMFPFTLVETPAGVYVGTSFYCSSVRQNSGRPLSEHQGWLQGMISRSGRVTEIESEKISIRPEVFTDWADYIQFENELLSSPLHRSLLACAGSQPGQLFAAWRAVTGDDFALVERLLASATYAVLKLFLSETRAERLASFDQAFLHNHPLELEEFGWRGRWDELQELASTEFDHDLRRWSKMQVHRKYLIASGQVLDNLWTLALVPPFVRCLTSLYAHREGRAANQADFYQALEQAELYLGSNGLRLARLTPHFSAHLLEALGTPA